MCGGANEELGLGESAALPCALAAPSATARERVAGFIMHGLPKLLCVQRA